MPLSQLPVRHLVRIATVEPLLGASGAGLAVLAVAPRPSPGLYTLCATAVAATGAHLVDDPAAATLAALPVSRACRHAQRAVLAAVMVWVWWAGASAVAGDGLALRAARHGVVLATATSLGLAAAALVAHRGNGPAGAPGTAGVLTVVTVQALAFLPALHLGLLPSNPAAPGAALVATAVLAVTLVAQALGTSDPAARWALGSRRPGRGGRA